MKPETLKAYRAWQIAAERGYGRSGRCNPVSMARADARIRRLKNKYESLLIAERDSEPKSVLQECLNNIGHFGVF